MCIRDRACTSGMLVERQIKPGDPNTGPDVPRLGGWFTEGITRMDDQQHALSALLLSLIHISEPTRPY